MTASTITEVVAVVERHRYFFQTEYDLQAALADVLAPLATADCPLTREQHVPGVGRIDFALGRVGVEVKIKGPASGVIRQLGRYARSGQFDGLVLVTACASHLSIPRDIFGTPVGVATTIADLR